MLYRRLQTAVVLVSLFALLALGMSLAACDDSGSTTASSASGGDQSSSSTSVSSGTVASSQPSGDRPVLKIGALLSLQSVQGVEIKKWLDVFAKVYNDAGGWKIGDTTYEVQPVVYETGVIGDVNASRAAVEKAVLQDDVRYLIGQGDTPAQTLQVTEPNGVLWIGMDWTEDSVKPDLKYAIRGQGLFFAQGFVFYVCQDFAKQGAKTVAIVGPDTQSGQVGAQMCAASAQAAGLQVVDTMFYSADTTDFSPIATKIASKKPDAVIYSFIAGATIVNLTGALKDAGWHGFIHLAEVDHTVLDALVKKVGKEYLEGDETAWYDPTGIETDDKTVKYIETYKEMYGDWHTDGCFWVGPWFFLEDAINATQSTDVETISAYLRDSKRAVKTLTGYSQLFARPDLQNFATVDSAPGHYIGVVRDGKLQYAETIACKDQYLASIMIYGLTDIYKQYWVEYGYPEFPDQPARLDFSDLE